MMLGLQRTRTAREAIKAMTKLVDDYGYGDTGESISVADPKKPGFWKSSAPAGRQGAAWAAVRIPDGQISCHTNISRIGEIPRNDPANWLHSDNVERFAASKGWYDPKSGKPFRFNETYARPRRLPAHLRDADLEHLPPGGPVAEVLARLSPLEARPSLIRCGSSRTTSFRRPTCSPDARPLRGHASTT